MLFRQTNIIWVAFVAGTIIVKCVELSHGNYIYGYVVLLLAVAE